ncbi:MAG: ABC transporter permease [Clostridiales bacterium]|nr:ABC transporter permease [Clostridiales bacterium]
MRAFDLAFLAFRNVCRGKSRVSLSSLSVTIGISAVILLTSVGQAAKEMIVEKLSGFGVDGVMVFAGDYEGLTAGDGETITQRVAGVDSSMPFDFWFGYYSVHSGMTNACLMIGTDETIGDYMDIELADGRIFTAAECRGGEQVCIVDRDLALSHFGYTSLEGRSINLIVDGKNREFTIVGVCESSMASVTGLLGVDIPPFVYIPWTSLGKDENSDLGQLALKLSDGADSAEVRDNVAAVLKSTNPNGRAFDVEDMTAYSGGFGNIMNTVTMLLAATAAISLGVAGIGVMNTMLAGVSERKGEIGVCKAIGASSKDICLIYLAEALIISLAGCAAGAAVGVCATATAFFLVLGRLPVFTAPGILIPCGVTVLVGLLSGVVPAIKAASLQPIKAIRKD